MVPKGVTVEGVNCIPKFGQSINNLINNKLLKLINQLELGNIKYFIRVLCIKFVVQIVQINLTKKKYFKQVFC